MEFDLSKRHCYWFNEICKIPHGSLNEEAVSNYIKDIAIAKGYKVIQDEMFNLIVYVPATSGQENTEPLIITAHMDMVCEKNKDSDHDFLKDPLDLYVEDGFLKANGTTLGADDGKGVAYMLAIMEDETLTHPPLELVFTVQEEIGLCGALNLKSEYFKAKRVISLDGGGEVSTAVSSAGGCIFNAIKKLNKEKVEKDTYTLSIRGLSGGHSGGEIHKEKGNSNVLAARMLMELDSDIKIASIDGGLKDNAIPRECDIVFETNLDEKTLKERLDKSANDIKEELEFSDPGFFYELAKTEVTEVASLKDSDDILSFMYLMPNGFMHKSMVIEGLTITSLNLGVVKTTDSEIILEASIRSALESGIDNLVRILTKLAKKLDFEYYTSARYPGWNFSKDSKLRETFREVLKDLYNEELIERAGHGGNECGVFKKLLNSGDIITLGAIAVDIHTPKEKLDLASFDKSYEILKEVVRRSC